MNTRDKTEMERFQVICSWFRVINEQNRMIIEMLKKFEEIENAQEE